MNIFAQKQSRARVGLDTISKIGIFSLSLLVTAVAVYLYSPIIKSNAAEDTSEVSATVASVAAVTLDTHDLTLNFPTPTPEGSFNSGTITATVSTNSTGGYELYFSSVDNSTDMTNANALISDVIASDFSGTVTSSTMAANKWGYSLDDTNFSKIPTLSAQAKIKDIDHHPSSAERSNPVKIGVKVNSDLKAGSYSKSVVFSAVAHTSKVAMQNFDKTTLVNTGDSMILTDLRDGNEYTVTKLADGNVWMTQNLRLAGGELTSSNTDISAASYTLPNNNWGDSLDSTDKYNNAYTFNTNNNSYGVYYNYAAATAGTITGTSNSTEATQSICPKGWKMPSQAEYANLLSVYGVTNDAAGSAIMRGSPLNFVYSGYINYNSTSPSNQGSHGYWWSTTAYNATARYNTNIAASSAGATNLTNRYYGFTLRCVAR